MLAADIRVLKKRSSSSASIAASSIYLSGARNVRDRALKSCGASSGVVRSLWHIVRSFTQLSPERCLSQDSSEAKSAAATTWPNGSC